MAPPRRRKANIRRPSGGPPGRTPTSAAAQTRANISRARTSKADIARGLDIARGRKEFFSNRPDVSDDRALRRMTQADEVQRFKNLYTKPVQGSSNLLQMTADAPMSLSQFRQQTANKYGPTFKEIGSDIGFGLGSIAKGVGQKLDQGAFGITGIIRGLYNTFTDNAAKAKDALVKGFDKLTSVEQEIAKNKDSYPRMTSHPRLQEITNLENQQMTELEKAELIRNNMEMITTPVTQSGDFTDDSFRRTPATGITSAPRVFDNRFLRMPGSGYQAGAGLPTIVDSQTDNIQITDGQAKPITDQEFMEQEQKANEMFNDPFFIQNQIVTDYVSPEDRMQNLINQNKQNNNTMFNSGVMTPKQTEDMFSIDLQ